MRKRPSKKAPAKKSPVVVSPLPPVSVGKRRFTLIEDLPYLSQVFEHIPAGWRSGDHLCSYFALGMEIENALANIEPLTRNIGGATEWQTLAGEAVEVQ